MRERRVVRLNEAGLRRLVREMIGGTGTMTRERGLAAANRFTQDYGSALESYGDPDYVVHDALYREFAPRLRAEAEALPR
jgi:hypothetical protein